MPPLHDAIFSLSGTNEVATARLGEAVPIDLTALIQRIVVSPQFPKWAIRSLQKTVDSAGIDVQVEESSLLDQPCAGVCDSA